MRNFVVKHDFNRASTHKSLKDYQRISKQEVMDTSYEELEDEWPDLKMEENWDINEEDLIPLKDPSQWESSNTSDC